VKAVVTGAAGSLGRRTCRGFAEAGATVLGVDRVALDGPLPVQRLDLERADLVAAFRGADVVVHLAQTITPEASTIEDGVDDLDVAQRVLDAAAEAGVRHAVILSSAMVYGAWENNSVPLTEDAPIRPNPEFLYAVHLAELERRALDWRADHPASSLTILRPAVVVTDEARNKLADLLRSVGKIRTTEGDPPVQFVHADDLASAVVVTARAEVDGVVNVAPDGWIGPETFAALASNAPRPRVSKWLATAVASIRWRFGFKSGPPGLVPYTVYPWVVANDRLRALGWTASNSNEEAFVAGHDPGPLDRLNARRKQQITLGIVGGAMAASVATAVGLVVRRRRRRS
jgi:nucleoside-diphosphate-sugar epimerase